VSGRRLPTYGERPALLGRLGRDVDLEAKDKNENVYKHVLQL